MSEPLNNQNKTILKIFLGLVVLAIVLILLLCAQSFYLEDDYLFMFDLNKNGIWKNCLIMYNTWDGRFFTLGGFVQAFCLHNLPIQAITFIWSLCFLISGLIVYYIIKVELNLPNTTKIETYLILLLFPIVFWLGSFFHLYQTVYWGTGGIYSFFLFIGAIWILYYLKYQKTNITLTQKIAFIIFSVFASASTENLSIALITLVLITIIIDYFEKSKLNNYFNYSILVALIAGLLIIVLAPGNNYRLEILNRVPKPFGLIYFTNNFLIILAKYSISSLAICFLSILLSFILNKNSNFSYKLPRFKTKNDRLELLKNSKWLLVAASTITPFLTIPECISKRTTIYFLFFIMIFIIVNFVKTNNPDSIRISRISFDRLHILIILFLSFAVIFYNFHIGIQLKNEVSKRENILKRSKNKTAYIKLIDPKLKSNCFRFTDFEVDGKASPSYLKTYQEDYFQTKIVIVK